ncbi:alpha/beta hydrolase [Trichothermofontia sichuanensis B231]|uniref:alpha/beta hydrolase n=1 Tax=Trichothermofontia sichuanensis TaxID=3045816 RepID=UPI002245E37B|nr:alpha/beta hydrolase [Trichothermofontia sichuanensis]UZQ55279.1 alpha/beta hydrolase [Trichothermofontia sichuanensis B231]
MTRLFPSLILGVGASLVCLTTRAEAIDQVRLQFRDRTATVSIGELRSFVRGSAAPQQLLDFFQATGQRAEAVRNLLGDQITLGTRPERFLETSTGQFVLLQLDRLIAGSDSRTQLEALRTTVQRTLSNDNRLSILELLENYPESTVTVDLNGLESIYNRISGFINRVEPALEAVKSFLRDLICDCPQNNSSVLPPPAHLSAQATTGKPRVCVNQAGELVPLQTAHAPITAAVSAAVMPIDHRQP